MRKKEKARLRTIVGNLKDYAAHKPAMKAMSLRRHMRDCANIVEDVINMSERLDLKESSTSDSKGSRGSSQRGPSIGGVTNLSDELNRVITYLRGVKSFGGSPVIVGNGSDSIWTSAEALNAALEIRDSLLAPAEVQRHFMNVDITEDHHLWDMLEEIVGYALEENCWDYMAEEDKERVIGASRDIYRRLAGEPAKKARSPKIRYLKRHIMDVEGMATTVDGVRTRARMYIGELNDGSYIAAGRNADVLDIEEADLVAAVKHSLSKSKDRRKALELSLVKNGQRIEMLEPLLEALGMEDIDEDQ